MSTHRPQRPPGSRHFTPFHSAAEEAAMKTGEAEWDNEGGHMSSTAGRIVRTPGAMLPYKVVMTLHGRADQEQAFATMQDAEEFIRRNTPIPSSPRTTYDRPADAKARNHKKDSR
jgi:hypothetical protein